MTETAAISILGLSLAYRKVPVLSDISLSIPIGERRAIIGPNGAGKTTLFNALSGLLAPTAGQIFLFECDITTRPPHQRALLGLGRTFQITSLFRSLTIRDNVLLALARVRGGVLDLLTPMWLRRRLIEEANNFLSDWGLADLAEVPVRIASYGVQRQLEILLALVQEPRVLLLDEPTSGLTIVERDRLVELVRRLSRTVTLVMIEHDIRVAFAVAERVTVLSFGRVLVEGRPDEIENDANVIEQYLGRGS